MMLGWFNCHGLRLAIDYALSAKYKVYLVAIGKNAICSNVMAISTIINILLYLLFIQTMLA